MGPHALFYKEKANSKMYSNLLEIYTSIFFVNNSFAVVHCIHCASVPPHMQVFTPGFVHLFFHLKAEVQVSCHFGKKIVKLIQTNHFHYQGTYSVLCYSSIVVSATYIMQCHVPQQYWQLPLALVHIGAIWLGI